MRTITSALTVMAIIGLVLCGSAGAKDDVGSVVAIRGRAAIEREKKSQEARVKDAVLINDIITTFEASRAKMLFIDDSVLTLGEKSRMSVKEFVLGKGKAEKSVFNLIDGKMRSVVGRSGFEVHTPTAVAAARGTIAFFETGVMNGKKFTTVMAYEHEVCVESTDPKIPGKICMNPPMMITLIEGEPIGMPAKASDEQIRQMLKDTDTAGDEISVPAPSGKAGALDADPWRIFLDLPALPPIDLGNLNTTTPVNINITFP